MNCVSWMTLEPSLEPVFALLLSVSCQELVHDSVRRTAAKALTWRVLSTATTIGLAIFLLGDSVGVGDLHLTLRACLAALPRADWGTGTNAHAVVRNSGDRQRRG